jgi:DNA-binding response OmpR family regulator
MIYTDTCGKLILQALCADPGRIHSVPELVEIGWPAPRKRPNNPRQIVRNLVAKLRKNGTALYCHRVPFGKYSGYSLSRDAKWSVPPPDHGRYGPHSERLLSVFKSRPGTVLAERELIDAMWPNPDQEPECVEMGVRQAVYRLRRRGHAIENHWGRGYRYVGQ